MELSDLDADGFVPGAEQRIVTWTGLPVAPLALTPAMVRLEDVAHALGNVCRYAGHCRFYSVAEHSLHVADWLEVRGHNPMMVLTGLLHDAAEAYVGDMPRPLKRSPAMAWFREAEDRAHESVHAVLGGYWPHPPAVHEADFAVFRWEWVAVKRPESAVRTLRPHEATIAFLARYRALQAHLGGV